ncbi:hypothetical protein [Aeoliella sp. SH292]|uniref:hypothetical protein n=1 Tax=Aeoliella sp. SH292 TaxID=3454464 RepID=UPI003F9972E2
MSSSAPAHGALAPDSGILTGIYHQDRWGVGHFGDFLVSPELHERLRDFEGRRVRIEARRIVQPINPGPAFIQEITHIVAAPTIPVHMEVSARPSRILPRWLEVTVLMTNRGRKPIIVRLPDLTLIGSYPSQDQPKKVRESLFPGYTNKQLSVNHAASFLGWGAGYGGSPISSEGVLPSGCGIRIAPGQSFPVIAEPIAKSDGAEFKLSLRGRNGIEDAATWFQLEDLEESGQNRKDIKLSIDEVKTVGEWGNKVDVAMTLHSIGAQNPDVVVTPGKRTPMVAGILSGAAAEGEFRRVRVSSIGSFVGPSELQPLPSEGLTVMLRIEKPLHIQYRYEVLTEAGLVEVDFKLPD